MTGKCVSNYDIKNVKNITDRYLRGCHSQSEIKNYRNLRDVRRSVIRDFVIHKS